MGTVKGRNSMDLTEAKDKNRWQQYTEELYKKDLHDPDNHSGVICISEVLDISPGNLDSSLCFFQPSVSHDVLDRKSVV